jgi:hypothetical protein
MFVCQKSCVKLWTELIISEHGTDLLDCKYATYNNYLFIIWPTFISVYKDPVPGVILHKF